MLNDFNGYEDAFHGTRYDFVESIAKHGLKLPESIVDGRKINVHLVGS
jgi:hypothetical protein